MTAAVFMLKGQSLLDFVNERQDLLDQGKITRTELILEAGYVYDNGKPMYTEYYTELLNAKGIIPTTSRDVEDEAYEALSGTQQELYDSIQDKFGEKWDHEEIMEFMDELDDIGIETPEQLDDAYEYQSDEYNAEKEFAEYFITEVLCTGIPSILEGHIDWDSVWECELRYDYNTIEFDGTTYFFRNN